MWTFGERLRIARERAGLSQIDVYRSVNLNNKSLSRYEKDMTSPDPDTVKMLIQLYNVSSDFIMGLSDEMGGCRLSSSIDTENDISTDSLYKIYETLNSESKSKAVEYIKMLSALEKTKQ